MCREGAPNGLRPAGTRSLCLVSHPWGRASRATGSQERAGQTEAEERLQLPRLQPGSEVASVGPKSAKNELGSSKYVSSVIMFYTH